MIAHRSAADGSGAGGSPAGSSVAGGSVAPSSGPHVLSTPHPGALENESQSETARALERGARALIARQAADGSWEGEVVWSAMLAAQLVLACHLMGRPIAPLR